MKRVIAALTAALVIAGCGFSSGGEGADLSLPDADSASAPASASSSAASASGPQAAQYLAPIAAPVLVTSLGQGTDGLLVREMLSDLDAEFDFEQTTSPDSLTHYQTVILAVGASTKALAGQGVSAAQELVRCQALLEALTSEQLVIMVRLGDRGTQDALTASLIDLALQSADVVLLAENSDRDGAIAGYAAEHGLVLKHAQTIRKMTGLFEAMLEGTLTP